MSNAPGIVCRPAKFEAAISRAFARGAACPQGLVVRIYRGHHRYKYSAMPADSAIKYRAWCHMEIKKRAQLTSVAE